MLPLESGGPTIRRLLTKGSGAIVVDNFIGLLVVGKEGWTGGADVVEEGSSLSEERKEPNLWC